MHSICDLVAHRVYIDQLHFTTTQIATDRASGKIVGDLQEGGTSGLTGTVTLDNRAAQEAS